MTQTRLSNFFKKALDTTPCSSPGENAEEDTASVNEKDPNPEDTTLVLKETDNLDNKQRNIHEDTTLKIDEVEQSDDDDDYEGQEDLTKTLVINITLQGVPNETKKNDDSKNNNTDHKSKKRSHNNSKVKFSPSPKKVKSTAKRKIKALFGDSSGSGSEPEDAKKVKIEPEFLKQIKEHQKSKSSKTDRDSKNKEKHKSKSTKLEPSECKQNNLASEQGNHNKSDSSETKLPRKESKRNKEQHRESKKHKTREHNIKSKSSENKQKKLKKKDENRSHKETQEKQKTENDSKSIDVKSIFGNLSGSDSEKDLIIDEGLESSINNEDNTLHDLQTNAKDTELVLKMEEIDSGETDAMKTLDNNIQQQINSSDKLNSSITEINDNKLDKAHKLSKEADKVLQELKIFSEKPLEPEVIAEKKVEKKVKSTEPSGISLSPSKHKSHESKKHKLSLTSKKKDKHSVEVTKEKRPNVNEERKEKDRKSGEHFKEKRKDKEDPSKKYEKVDVASLVVKLLMPYYKKKKISSRDLFKITARHIVHQLLAIQITGKKHSV